MNLLIHHHWLHKDMLPTEIAQMQDGSNAFNEMEPCAITEGIFTAPIVHRAFYNYFISATIDPTPIYIPGSTLPVYWVKKRSKQGCPPSPPLLRVWGSPHAAHAEGRALPTPRLILHFVYGQAYSS